MNLEEKYQKEREKIRLKYGKMFKLLYDEIKNEQLKYLKKKNKIKEKYDDLKNLDLLLKNI